MSVISPSAPNPPVSNEPPEKPKVRLSKTTLRDLTPSGTTVKGALSVIVPPPCVSRGC
jgi:hypothetical protein